MVRNNTNFQKDNWELLFEFALDLIDFSTYYLLLFFLMFESSSITEN